MWVVYNPEYVEIAMSLSTMIFSGSSLCIMQDGQDFRRFLWKKSLSGWDYCLKSRFFFLSRVLVCYVENGQKCQVNLILKNQYLPICFSFFSPLNGYKTLFLYFGRNEIVYILVYKILFSNIFLSNLSKIALKFVARMMMHTCRKNSLD